MWSERPFRSAFAAAPPSGGEILCLTSLLLPRSCPGASAPLPVGAGGAQRPRAEPVPPLRHPPRLRPAEQKEGASSHFLATQRKTWQGHGGARGEPRDTQGVPLPPPCSRGAARGPARDRPAPAKCQPRSPAQLTAQRPVPARLIPPALIQPGLLQAGNSGWQSPAGQGAGQGRVPGPLNPE